MFDLKDIRTTSDSDPRHYLITDDGLKKAVNMAIWLQKPLLLTGAPGTGKTQLASKVAYELSQTSADALNGFAPFSPKPLSFFTKTTSSASDLFYSYDAIGHFQKRHIEQNGAPGAATSAHPYLQLNALGMAILQTYGKRKILADPQMSELAKLANFDSIADEPMSSVVLIDEIDKAPRDFPNDLLNEIEHYRFTISELNKSIQKADAKQSPARIVVIMTSNFEKNLPDAFLRRCLFYHIPSPDTEKLFEIVCSRMEPYLQIAYANGRQPKSDADIRILFNDYKPKIRETIIKGFDKARVSMIDKQPSTSELLEWIKVLEAEGFFTGAVDFDNLTNGQKTILKYTMPIIAKSKDDLENAMR
ncbi:MAG: AAA family ATPase [Chitinophagaceae bacterium]|nr:AAA family ATPase [Chitinophagaceae bacterium]